MHALAVLDTNTALSTELERVTARQSDFRKASTADNTKKAYGSAWRDFTSWCEQRDLSHLPASSNTVSLYLSDRAGDLKLSSLKIRVAAISKAHKVAGLPFDSRDPIIAEVVSGIARTYGSAVAKKDAATVEILRDAIRAYAAGERLKNKRDRALLAIGFFGALRRSELAAIDVEHITETADGLVLHLPRRKTDQLGEGTTIGLPKKADETICPVAAFKAYVETAGLTSGPLFRSVSKGDRLLEPRLSDIDVARAVKAATKAAGYDEKAFSGHSLRAGFITSAATRGISDHLIAQISGHRSMDVLAGYVRRSNLFKHNAGAMI